MERLKFKEYISKRLKNKGLFAILLSYIAFCLFSVLAFCFVGRARGVFMAASFILFVPLMFALEHFFGLHFGNGFVFWAFFLAAGSILGSCYNLYSVIPFFDTILHGLSGTLFAMFGFMIGERFFGGINNSKELFGCIIFGILCSLSVAVLWEIFEYCGESFFGMDTQVDSITNEIRSHFLAGSHNDIVVIEDIEKTVIHYADGKTYVIDGYLDIGRDDTLIDMIICTVGALVYTPFAAVNRLKSLSRSSKAVAKI